MTAPTKAPTEVEAVPAPEVALDADAGEWPVRFPVMAVEGLDTSDGRYLTPGTIIARACPMSILAQPFASHGGQEPPYAVLVGRLDRVERVPGPSVVSRRTGEPFPEGSFVWVGHGAVDPSIDVHGLNIGNLLRRRFLNGASVDLAGMDVEMVGEEGWDDDPDNPRRQMIAHRGEQAAITLVPIPAFGDAYVELVGDDEPFTPADPEEFPEGFAASAFPAWRSAEIGDTVSSLTASLVAAADEAHTGGMIALVPADPAALTVDGGTPADELHLTLAYLGDDVTDWPEESRTGLLTGMEQLATHMPAVEAEVMGHALFNPTGAHDREPCAVHLVSGAGLAEAKAAVADHDKSEHPIFLPHITAGFGLDVSALSYVGPVVFDKLRVAMGEDVTDYPLMAPAETAPVEDGDEPVTAAADAPAGVEAEPADEVGMPDAPQPCEFGDHPAIRSLLFDEDAKYLPVCEDDEQQGRDLIEQNGATVTRVVDIPPAEAVLP